MNTKDTKKPVSSSARPDDCPEECVRFPTSQIVAQSFPQLGKVVDGIATSSRRSRSADTCWTPLSFFRFTKKSFWKNPGSQVLLDLGLMA